MDIAVFYYNACPFCLLKLIKMYAKVNITNNITNKRLPLISPVFQGDEKMKRFGSLISGKPTVAVCAAHMHSQGQIIWNSIELISFLALHICPSPTICYPSQLLTYHKFPAVSSADTSILLPNPLYDFAQPYVKLPIIHFQGSGLTPPLFSFCLSIKFLNEYHFKNQNFLGLHKPIQERERELSKGHHRALDTALPSLDLGRCGDRGMCHTKRWCNNTVVTDVCICKRG